MSSQVRIFTSESEFQTALSSVSYLVVDFFATWCPPCKMLSGIIDEMISKQTLGSQVQIAKVDTDQLTALSSEYGIRSLPTVVFFHKGKEVSRFSGFRPAHEFKALAQKAFGDQAEII